MPQPTDYAWEKEFAPKISGTYVAFVAILYALWISGMIAIAVNRWFGSLQ
jgi:hypothetical protein